MAQQLGVSKGKTNYLIAALLEKGLIKIESFQRHEGKLGKIAYLLTAAGIKNRTALTRNYLARKEAEYKALKAEIDNLRNIDNQLPSESALTAATGSVQKGKNIMLTLENGN